MKLPEKLFSSREVAPCVDENLLDLVASSSQNRDEGAALAGDIKKRYGGDTKRDEEKKREGERGGREGGSRRGSGCYNYRACRNEIIAQ